MNRAFYSSLVACLALLVVSSAIAGEDGAATPLSTAAATGIARGAREFIQHHCADCHDSATKEAGLDLTAIPFDAEDKANFSLWVRVHDRAKAGEMPPKYINGPPFC